MAKISISINKTKRNLHSSHQINTREKPAGNFWYDLLKYIFVTFKMIRSSSGKSIF